MAGQEDCQACPVKEACLPPRQKWRYITPTMYYPEYQRAKERDRTDEYRVQLRLGHESIQTTVHIYGHMLSDSDAVAADTLERMLATEVP